MYIDVARHRVAVRVREEAVVAVQVVAGRTVPGADRQAPQRRREQKRPDERNGRPLDGDITAALKREGLGDVAQELEVRVEDVVARQQRRRELGIGNHARRLNAELLVI